MKIPKDLLITLEIARETKIGSKISELNLLSPKHCLLSSYILLEKNNPNSKWTPYLDILPKSYDNFPIFFNDEELSFLNGSPFLLVISNKKRDILADYNKIITVLFNDLVYS
jgi:histone-lysine N-methyltransferase SETD3